MKLIAAAVLVTLAGCGGPRDASDAHTDTRVRTPATPDTTSHAAPARRAPARADVIHDTIMIEGMPEIERATLISAPAGFAVPFSTYLPQGMRVDFQTQEDAATVRFYAAFGGTANHDAYLEVHAPSRDAPAATARDVASATIRSSAGTAADISDTEGADWAEDAVTFTYRKGDGTHVTGRVMIARHEERRVRYVFHYPSEYGDGMGPRIARILSHWRWVDTGAPLGGR